MGNPTWGSLEASGTTYEELKDKTWSDLEGENPPATLTSTEREKT